MKLCRYLDDSGRAIVGLVEGEHVVPVADGDGRVGQNQLLALAMSRGTVAPRPLAAARKLSEVRLLAPIPTPPSLRDFNAFEEHVKLARRLLELPMDQDWYDAPSFYFSNPGAVRGPEDEVIVPRTQALDYELEVAAVIGVDAYDVKSSEALHIIAGYTIFNDWSARDLIGREMRGGQGPAKAKDFASTLGPFLVTADELPDAETGRPRAAMAARVNGEQWSKGELADIFWPWSELVAFAGRDTWLRQGDVIGSGTCATGSIMELIAATSDGNEGAYRYLRPGDAVELEVGGLGVLSNRVRAATDRAGDPC